jgi:SAM-dependent methyltransferase
MNGHTCPRGKQGCRTNSLGRFNDDTGRGEKVEVLLCAACDLAFTVPVVSSLTSLYKGRTSKDFQPNEAGFIRALKNFAFDREAVAIIRQLQARPRVVVDFGCGNGRVTNALARAFGPSVSVIGVDFEPTPPIEIQRLGLATYLPYAELAGLRGSVDLIVSRHSLEHAADPVAMLLQMRDCLSTDGQVYIEVPNRRTPWARIFHRAWDGWYTPYHRVHFSRASLRECLRQAGFAVLRESGAEMPNMGRTVRNLLGCRYNIALFGIGVALHPLQVLGGIATREPACLRAVARVGNVKRPAWRDNQFSLQSE